MKIIGIGNALMDVLAVLGSDEALTSLGLMKGGMTLINEEDQLKVNDILQPLNPSLATGGSAGNAILALAHLGAAPGFIGKVGRDDMGQRLRQCYEQVGIEARLISADQHTGVANTFISPDGERTFATCLGAAAQMTADEVTDEMLSGYDLLHIEGYLVQNHELIEAVARMAKARGMKISIDLASYNVVASDLAFFRHLVEDYVDIVFANEEESAAFTGGKEPNEALQEIATMCEVAVVKLGKRGAMALELKAESRKLKDESIELKAESRKLKDESIELKDESRKLKDERADCDAVFAPAYLVPQVVDTTAAGDFFAGGFLYAFSRGASLESCLRTGALLSSKVIQVVGTQVTEEMWKEVNEVRGER